MQAIIGITANYSNDDRVGLITHLGLKDQRFQLLPDDYVTAVSRSGGIPVILPMVKDTESMLEFVKGLDGIIFTGGSDILPVNYGEDVLAELGYVIPERDRHEIAMFKELVHNTDLPILGVCRGMQVGNVALGGTLYQDLKKQRPESDVHEVDRVPRTNGVHWVQIEKDSLLERSFPEGKTLVNSFHHQAVRNIAGELKPVAKAADGIVEALEGKDRDNLLLVQWHPEMLSLENADHQSIFTNFVEACAARKEKNEGR